MEILEELFKSEEEIRMIIILGVFIVVLFLSFAMLGFFFFFSWFFFFGVLRTLTPLTIEMAIISAYFINILVWAILACRTLRRKQ